MAIESSLEGNEINMEEIGRSMQEVERLVVECPKGDFILGVFEMPGAHQKPKWAPATITKLAQKLARTVKNQWHPNIPLVPLIPARATTTKLAQKVEKHRKEMKTMFTQMGWLPRRQT